MAFYPFEYDSIKSIELTENSVVNDWVTPNISIYRITGGRQITRNNSL